MHLILPGGGVILPVSQLPLPCRGTDAFVTIPGGFGTLDETLEITTWQQLGFHTKPVGVVNVNGFFDHLLAFLDHAAQEVRVSGGAQGTYDC